MWTLERTIAALLIIVGLINVIPLIGIVSAQRLQSLYGLTALDSQLTLLLRHRALLFGLVGSVIILSAFVPALRVISYPMALLSMVGFIVLAPSANSLNPELLGVIRADWVGIGLCLLALCGECLRLWLPRTA